MFRRLRFWLINVLVCKRKRKRKMSKYIIEIPEIYIHEVEIEAASVEEAVAMVSDGKGEERRDAFFHFTLEPENYGVRELCIGNKVTRLKPFMGE
jgi:hypothetical protein